MGNQRHAENLLGIELSLLAGAGNFNAAALAAASGMNLRLDNDAACALGKEFAGHRGGFFQRVGYFASGHGHAIFRQDFFCLIFMNFHVDLDRSLPLWLGNSEPCPVNAGHAKPCQRYMNSILRGEGAANRD